MTTIKIVKKSVQLNRCLFFFAYFADYQIIMFRTIFVLLCTFRTFRGMHCFLCRF